MEPICKRNQKTRKKCVRPVTENPGRVQWTASGYKLLTIYGRETILTATRMKVRTTIPQTRNAAELLKKNNNEKRENKMTVDSAIRQCQTNDTGKVIRLP